jgi:SAM-dependent methyltransferase
MPSGRAYDKENQCLVEWRSKAGKEFWEDLWGDFALKEYVIGGSRHWFIRNITKKYLPLGVKVLDGGCGSGRIVYGLKSWGYDAYGADYAQATITKVKEVFPDLNITVGDVQKLPYPQEFFDGYWSLGVIEHFYDGFDGIIAEARRVLKPCGILFLVFPYMNPLRRIKAFLGSYPTFDEKFLSEGEFYQFLLSAHQVAKHVQRLGFQLIHSRGFDPTRCLTQDAGIFNRVFEKVYNSPSLWARGVRGLNHVLLSSFAGHSALLVLKKI